VTQLVRIQLQDGTVLLNPPHLIDATTTFNSVHEWGATYYFTINVPQQAENPSKGYQQSGGDNIRFKLKDSRAFERNRKGESD